MALCNNTIDYLLKECDQRVTDQVSKYMDNGQSPSYFNTPSNLLQNIYISNYLWVNFYLVSANYSYSQAFILVRKVNIGEYNGVWNSFVASLLNKVQEGTLHAELVQRENPIQNCDCIFA